MKTITSLSLDAELLEQAKSAAAEQGLAFSVWTEKLIRTEVLHRSVLIAARYERSQGRDSEEYFAAAEAERAAMAEAIRSSGTAW
jgi:hypothetical protein